MPFLHRGRRTPGNCISAQRLRCRSYKYGSEYRLRGDVFGVFLATVDPDVDISIVRDTDSRFSKYELKMVNEWLASGKKFHAMYPIYSRHPIQAGMWGVRGPILEFREPLEDRLRSTDFSNANRRGLDQDFLLHNLYPLTKGDVYVHEASRHLNNSYYRGELPTKRDLQGPIAFLDDPVKTAEILCR